MIPDFNKPSLYHHCPLKEKELDSWRCKDNAWVGAGLVAFLLCALISLFYSYFTVILPLFYSYFYRYFTVISGLVAFLLCALISIPIWRKIIPYFWARLRRNFPDIFSFLSFSYPLPIFLASPGNRNVFQEIFPHKNSKYFILPMVDGCKT